jgi:hypothetical protein
VRRSLPIEIDSEQRFAVDWRTDSGGAKLAAGVLEGVLGELHADIGSDGLAGAGSLDGSLPLVRRRPLSA